MPLRPLRASDIAPLSAWLVPLAGELRCARWENEQALRDAIGANDVLLYTEGEGRAFIAYRTQTPVRDSARVELLAVARHGRRLGLGSRAALALERRLARSTQRLYVRVPAQLGLALYFWLRLGYRPLTQGDWPAARDDRTSTWMVRELP